MDDQVLAALRKWPHVPHVRGWLGFDARGDWYLRDATVQAAGPFPASRGDRLQHEGLLAFIGRNQGVDERGCWYFQNGPQRVYVELEAAPYVWRLHTPPPGRAAASITSTTGRAAVPGAVWLDDSGRCFLDTDLGFGLVHSLDVPLAADAIERGAWQVRGTVPFTAMPARFGYVLSPSQDGAQNAVG